MKFLLKLLTLGLAVAAAQVMLPAGIRPGDFLPKSFGPKKPLQTVLLSEAQERVDASRGKPTISVLYMTMLPTQLRDDLADGIKRWQKGGAAVHAFSIDAVQSKAEIPGYARDLGKDVAPVWIQMPEGAACAFEQLAAVNAFAGLKINPQAEIPLLTLVLRDANGKVVRTKAVTVPNGGVFDPEELMHAIAPFDVTVRRVLR